MYMILGKSKVWVQGGSLVAVIPKTVAENLGIRAGDVVVFGYVDGKIVLMVPRKGGEQKRIEEVGSDGENTRTLFEKE